MYGYFSDFSVQIILAELIVMFPIKRRRLFWPRIIPCCLVFCFVPQLFDDFYNLKIFTVGWYNTSWMLMFSLSIMIIWFCFDASLKTLLFYSTVGYAMQHLVVSVRYLINLALFHEQETPFSALIRFFITVGFYALLHLIFVRPLRHVNLEELHLNALIVFSLVSLFTVNVLSFLIFYMDVLNIGTTIYDCVCTIFLLVIQSGIFERNRLRREQEITVQLLEVTQRQSESSKENIDLINRKCHDLKHQIAAMKFINDQETWQKNVEEIKNAVEIYDSRANTGNAYLDAVLMEKGLLCSAKKIWFTYLISGEKLGFMEPVDIYSLFGNALDNAIEAVGQEDEGHRIITIESTSRGSLLSIRIENYCSHQLVFEDGMPVSTKEKNGYHGFGTKSIRYIIEKYGGQCIMTQKDDRFILSLLFNI